MHGLDEARSALEGREFDWLLFDAVGAVALCETAGYGEMPDLVLGLGSRRFDDYSEAIDRLRTLPVTGACREEGKGVGADSATLAYGTRGLYVYDWKHWSGPYQRVVVPERPVPAGVVEAVVREFRPVIPSVRIEFGVTRGFQLRELLPCR